MTAGREHRDCKSLPVALVSQSYRKTMNIQTQTFNVDLNVAKLVPIAKGLSQKNDVNPIVINCCNHQRELKYVKDVSCVDQLSFVKHLTNVPTVTSSLPVGARLQNFGTNLGAGPKVVQILREGYTLPFRIWPNLTRSPTIISCYVNPNRNLYLLEALHQLIDKNRVELVKNQTSLGFSADWRVGMRSGPLCTLLWRILTWYSRKQVTLNSQRPTYSRANECGSRQAIQTRPDHSNRVVTPPRGLPNYATGGTSLR